MGILFAYSKKQRAKVKAVGKTVDIFALFVAIGKCLTERILKEKEVSLEDAEKIVVNGIKDGMKTIGNERR